MDLISLAFSFWGFRVREFWIKDLWTLVFYRFVDFDLGVSWRVSQLPKTTAPPASYDHLFESTRF